MCLYYWQPWPACFCYISRWLFWKTNFFIIEIYLFIELQLFQGSLISFDTLIWNRKAFKTVRRFNSLDTLVSKGGLLSKTLLCYSIFWERSANFVVKKYKNICLSCDCTENTSFIKSNSLFPAKLHFYWNDQWHIAGSTFKWLPAFQINTH